MKGNRGIRIRSQVERQTQDPGGCGWKGKHSFLEKGVCRKVSRRCSYIQLCVWIGTTTERHRGRQGMARKKGGQGNYHAAIRGAHCGYEVTKTGTRAGEGVVKTGTGTKN